MQGKGSLPEPVALLEHDVGNGDEDHHHAACDEEGPVDITEPQVLVGQQVAAGGVGGDHAVLVAVQELPLVADGVVQVQAGVKKERCVKIFICMLVCVLINVHLWKPKLFVVDARFIVIKKNIEVR